MEEFIVYWDEWNDFVVASGGVESKENGIHSLTVDGKVIAKARQGEFDLVAEVDTGYVDLLFNCID